MYAWSFYFLEQIGKNQTFENILPWNWNKNSFFILHKLILFCSESLLSFKGLSLW